MTTPPDFAFPSPLSSPGEGGQRVNSFPVSFAQQRLWFLHYLEPGISSYNLPLIRRLLGPLDVGALQESLNEIAKRHDVLRTSFPISEGRPIQVIARSMPVPLPNVDLRDVPAAEREAEAARQAGAESSAPFDLATGPLFRAKLFVLGDEDHVLIVTMHHIVSDGWSVDVLMRELVALYDAFRLGKPSPLPDLPIQYADYALWQQKWLRGDVLDAQVDYWKKKLAGIPAVLELPMDRPRGPVPSVRGGLVSGVFPPGVVSGLSAFARGESATLFMTLLAAFQALLLRYTGQEDIAVGSPIAGRTSVETEPLIGFFVNTLVLRGDLSGDPSFRRLVARARETALEAFAHQDLPFEKLVEELQPARTLSHTPLFQVMFQLSSISQADVGFPDLIMQPFAVQWDTAKFDLSMRMVARGERLSYTIEYKTDLFDAATIETMSRHFRNLVLAAFRTPDVPVSRLPILSSEERQQLLSGWNEALDFPQSSTLHRRFEERVRQSPDQEAVVFEGERVSYRELNERANRLARHLARRGVTDASGTEMVGLCLERSIDLVVGILGILKAGAGYLPLDRSLPKERVAFLIQDSGVRLVVTKSERTDLVATAGVEMVQMDADGTSIAAESGEDPEPRGNPDSLAYVIYTSGSTGKPKGVLVHHRNVLRLFDATHPWFGFDERDTWTLFHSFGFDFSVWEIWGALLYGGRLVVVPYLVSRSPGDFHRLLRTERVTVLNQTPSAFQQLMAVDLASKSGAPLPLRLVIFGGEALDIRTLKPWFDRYGDQSPRLVNMYGITETTVHVTYRPLTAEDARGTASVLGRPIPDLQLYILDAALEPSPLGVRGEIYVGGAGVAGGYLHRPELTAQRFLPDPFRNGGGNIYKTGDLARRLHDGDLEYLGRSDEQVKIRGYRIEVGEIEETLRAEPSVRECAIVTEEKSGFKRLVAYVAVRPEAPATGAQLRDFLKRKLPDHMVPSSFVMVEALPLTPNGKLDRQALSKMAPEPVSVASVGTLPQDTLELILLRIWEDVLGVQSIGVEEDFFELGGHSLLSVRLFSDIEKVFGRTLPLATLFQAPTVERLAAKLREEGWQAPWSSLVVIHGGDKGKPPFFCVPGVGGNIVGFNDLARAVDPKQPVYGLQAKGLDGKEQPLTRIEDMAAHYIREILTVVPNGPFLIGGASFGGSVAYEIARQLTASGENVGLVALFDTFAPRDSGPTPFLTTLRRRAKSWKTRAVFHGRNLLFGTGRGNYIRSKSRTLRRRIRSRIWQMVYDSYQGSSKPLPRVLNDVREAGYLANRLYRPVPFPGKVTLFRAMVRSAVDAARPDMGWGRLAEGGVEIREVPGDHVNMLLKPQVTLLAEQLVECIERAIQDEPSPVREPEKSAFRAQPAVNG